MFVLFVNAFSQKAIIIFNICEKYVLSDHKHCLCMGYFPRLIAQRSNR